MLNHGKQEKRVACRAGGNPPDFSARFFNRRCFYASVGYIVSENYFVALIFFLLYDRLSASVRADAKSAGPNHSLRKRACRSVLYNRLLKVTLRLQSHLRGKTQVQSKGIQIKLKAFDVVIRNAASGSWRFLLRLGGYCTAKSHSISL